MNNYPPTRKKGLSGFLKRALNVAQMDWELAGWQMVWLAINPRRVWVFFGRSAKTRIGVRLDGKKETQGLLLEPNFLGVEWSGVEIRFSVAFWLCSSPNLQSASTYQQLGAAKQRDKTLIYNEEPTALSGLPAHL